MKQTKIKPLIGIAAGVAIGVIACGGASGVATAVAAMIGAASEVSFDGAKSGLAADTVQDAIDEIAAGDVAAFLVGEWNVHVYLPEQESSRGSATLSSATSDGGTVTFRDDGTWETTDAEALGFEDGVDNAGWSVAAGALLSLDYDAPRFCSCSPAGSAECDEFYRDVCTPGEITARRKTSVVHVLGRDAFSLGAEKRVFTRVK